jgi:hypothetical protein
MGEDLDDLRVRSAQVVEVRAADDDGAVGAV